MSRTSFSRVEIPRPPAVGCQSKHTPVWLGAPDNRRTCDLDHTHNTDFPVPYSQYRPDNRRTCDLDHTPLSLGKGLRLSDGVNGPCRSVRDHAHRNSQRRLDRHSVSPRCVLAGRNYRHDRGYPVTIDEGYWSHSPRSLRDWPFPLPASSRTHRYIHNASQCWCGQARNILQPSLKDAVVRPSSPSLSWYRCLCRFLRILVFPYRTSLCRIDSRHIAHDDACFLQFAHSLSYRRRGQPYSPPQFVVRQASIFLQCLDDLPARSIQQFFSIVL